MHQPGIATLSLTLAAAASLCAVQPATSQDLRYETATRVEMPGVAGPAMRMAQRLSGGGEAVETTCISGHRMRSDDGRRSTIIDMESGRMVHLDHDARTYFTTDVEAAPEEGARREQLGAFVVLTGVWSSSEVPGPDAARTLAGTPQPMALPPRRVSWMSSPPRSPRIRGSRRAQTFMSCQQL